MASHVDLLFVSPQYEDPSNHLGWMIVLEQKKAQLVHSGTGMKDS